MTLISVTQGIYFLGMLGMLATAAMFIIKRNDYKIGNRTYLDYSIAIGLVSFFCYWTITAQILLPGKVTEIGVNDIALALNYRALETAITLPVILLAFNYIAELTGASKLFGYRLVVSSVVATVTSYLAAIGSSSSAGTYVNVALSVIAWGYIIRMIALYKPAKGTTDIKNTFNQLRLFVYGWTIFPIAALVLQIVQSRSLPEADLKSAFAATAIVLVIADMAIKGGFLFTGLKAIKKTQGTN